MVCEVTQQYVFVYFCSYLLLGEFKVFHKTESGRIGTELGFSKCNPEFFSLNHRRKYSVLGVKRSEVCK